MDLQWRHRESASRSRSPVTALHLAGHEVRCNYRHFLFGHGSGAADVWHAWRPARMDRRHPDVASGVAADCCRFFLLLFFGRRSFVGHALQQIGITIVFSWPATVIAATVVAFPLMYRTTLGAFDQVNRNYLDAARTLGASEGVVFRRVLLPLAAPGVSRERFWPSRAPWASSAQR